MIEVNSLDLIAYVVLIIVVAFFMPEDYKEELGALAGCMIFIVITIVYIILFVIVDYNVIDIIIWIKENLRITW